MELLVLFLQGDTEARRTQGWGPAFRLALAIGERAEREALCAKKTPDVIFAGRGLSFGPLSDRHAAEGGTQPPPPWNPMRPMF